MRRTRAGWAGCVGGPVGGLPPPPCREEGDHLGLARDHALGRGRGAVGANVVTLRRPGSRSRVRTRSRRACSASRSSRAAGRRRSISRAPRRRSSTCSRGPGVSFQAEGGVEQAFAVGPGDCLVHRALEHAHTIMAGDDGLVVLAFGQRHYAANTLLPRAGVSWLGPTWVLEGAERITRGRERLPSARRRGTELAERPTRIVNVADVPGTAAGNGDRRQRRPAISAMPPGRSGAGSRTSPSTPGKLMNPPHGHSAEEEIFVVLEGSGTLLLYAEPACRRRDRGVSGARRAARSRDRRARSAPTRSARATTG